MFRKYITQKMTRTPRRLWCLYAAIVVLVIVALGYHLLRQPHVPQVTASITKPAITPVAKTLIPDVLTIDFGIQKGGFTPKSVIPLGNIGKEVSEGIRMEPESSGTWVWQTDSRLVFTPTQDWLAGQVYTIQFSKKVFASHIKMEKLDYTFTTRPFEAAIGEFKFYQDPVNPAIREAVATVHFNYPVEPRSFEKNTSLVLQALNPGAAHFKLTFDYDENKRTAWLHSEVLPLSDTPRYLVLQLDKGIRALQGSARTDEPVSQTVMIPDAASYFKVSGIDAAIVRNSENRPEQVIALQTTLGVSDGQLGHAIHVYLLPADSPASNVEAEKKNYAWQNPGEVTDTVLKLSTPLTLQPVPSDRDFATLHSYRIVAPPGRFLYIRVDKGIKSFGDYVLANDYASVVKVPDYPQEIGFLHQGALLALDSEKKLSVLVRGVPAVKFRMARVLPDQVNQLVTQTEGDFNNPRFLNTSFNENNISEIFSEMRAFSPDPAKAQYSALDIGKYLSKKINTGGPQGLFLLQATGWDTVNNTPLEVSASRLILITDLGLIVKDNADGSHDVFVESITRGVPVRGASVSIAGKNGLAILTRQTDAMGVAHFPTLKDFVDEREPAVYLAKLGNDVSFIPYNHPDRQLNFSRFDIGGIYSDPELQTASAYLFSDRGLYRPGETAHIGMIVKQLYAMPAAVGLPMDVIVTDPKGATVLDQKYRLDQTGYLALDVPTTPTSPTGQYTVNLFIVKDNHPDNLLGSTAIQVADFQPDRMRITSGFSTPATIGWSMPAGLTAKIHLQNLYGAPAVDRKVTANMILAPKRVQFSTYPDVIFIDPLLDPAKPPRVLTDTLPDSKTDSAGDAQFALNLERFDRMTAELTFSAEGFEAEGGRSVATESKILVSPLSYFVGYKPDGDLRYIKQNSARTVNFIAVNPTLQQQTVSGLKIERARLQAVTTLVKKPDGTFEYQSLMQTHVLDSKPFTVNAAGTIYSLPTNEIGDFVVTLLDEAGTPLSRFNYSVAGNSQLALAKNAELTVKLDKTEYKPDDEIELEITSPYAGTGLITIERDKVYATQWFKTTATHSIQKIRIPKDFEGNGYINVALVRDWNSPDIFMSPLSSSVVPFSVNHDSHLMHVDLKIPPLGRPGTPFLIQYKTDKPGKIIIFAVDEGILQVSDYKTPDPVGFFFQKRALQVITQQTVDQILPKFMEGRELSSVGGDGGEAALRSHLNPFRQKTDLPVVYWSGILDTDSTLRSLEYPIPDYFNGTLRVMAVAVSNTALGSAEKKSEVRGDFVVNPNVPTFVAPNDTFDITASIANNIKNSGKNTKIEVHASVTGPLEIIGNANETVLIDENQEKTVRFKLHALDGLGAAQINFQVSSGDKSAKMHATLSVRPASDYQTTVMSGSTKEAEKSLVPDRVLYSAYRELKAVASTNPLILFVGLQQYLDHFPYGCTEQLVSESFPLVSAAGESGLIEDPSRANQKIATTLQLLSERQMASGAFSYWPNIGDNASNPFASVYAMHFLTEAREKGYPVPLPMFQSGIGYLKSLAEADTTDLDQARIQAYAIYILTRNEIITTNYITRLQLWLDQDKKERWKKDITSAFLASTWQLMKGSDEANRLIRYYDIQANTDSTSDFYSHAIGNAEYFYLLARHFPTELPSLQKDLLTTLVASINTDEINTLLSSYTALALDAYGKSEDATGADKPAIDTTANKIIIHNPAQHTIFYQLTQSGFDKTLFKTPASHHLEITRDYRDLQGKPIDEATLGREVEVHIAVRALDDRTIGNVAIVDLLPGGFEVVNESVHANPMDYADKREDRVIFFGTVTPTVQEIVYRIRATNTGTFTLPPIFANALYDPRIHAHGVASRIQVIQGQD